MLALSAMMDDEVLVEAMQLTQDWMAATLAAVQMHEGPSLPQAWTSMGK